ncbi:MAG TPA: hypothetical protein VE961_19825 [Pyrinomonadaceae bacterium]|nr:hypothetical protein [Pyrinomonadaceae bacterium]
MSCANTTNGRGDKRVTRPAQNHRRSARGLFWLMVGALALGSLACDKRETEEHKSGRLNWVENLAYGPAGVHGQPGWHRTGQHLYVNDRRWSPPNIKMDDIARCEESPNPSVEALKCYSFAEGKESAFVLHMKGNEPEWLTASSQDYGGGYNLGEWAGDGRWLLFRDYYFDVTTGERKPVKGLPDYPGKGFRGASPDMKTIVYEHSPSNEEIDRRVIPVWLIDADTGTVKIIELSKDKYPAIDVSQSGEAGRNARFKSLLVWKRDDSGRDRLVEPTAD